MEYVGYDNLREKDEEITEEIEETSETSDPDDLLIALRYHDKTNDEKTKDNDET
jgi:hypothetical protein